MLANIFFFKTQSLLRNGILGRCTINALDKILTFTALLQKRKSYRETTHLQQWNLVHRCCLPCLVLRYLLALSVETNRGLQPQEWFMFSIKDVLNSNWFKITMFTSTQCWISKRGLWSWSSVSREVVNAMMVVSVSIDGALDRSLDCHWHPRNSRISCPIQWLQFNIIFFFVVVGEKEPYKRAVRIRALWLPGVTVVTASTCDMCSRSILFCLSRAGCTRRVETVMLCISGRAISTNVFPPPGPLCMHCPAVEGSRSFRQTASY